MRANSPSSIVASLSLHAVLVAIIFGTTMYMAQQDKVAPVIFELVAGPPTAPNELVAPALGNTANPVKLDVPQPEAKPVPPAPEVAKTAEPEVRETAPVKPKPDNSISKELKRSEKMSYKDYLKKHPTPKPAAAPVQRTASVPRIDAQGIANGVKGGSPANTRGGGGGKALTREEQSELDTYYSFLVSALRDAYEPPPGVSDQLKTQVTFDITASGALLNPRISKSSGDRAFDEAVLEAFRHVKNIGPTPNGKSDTITLTFRMKDPE